MNYWIFYSILTFFKKFKDEALNDILAVLDYTSSQVNIFEKLQVDKYLTTFGLVINPEYRGRGVATEMLNAMIPLGNALGIQAIASAFTGIGSQKAAEKAHYKDIYSIKLV